MGRDGSPHHGGRLYNPSTNPLQTYDSSADDGRHVTAQLSQINASKTDSPASVSLYEDSSVIPHSGHRGLST